MSAVNNTLREIILRERPLTVTNNGSLFLSFSLFLSVSLLLSLSFSSSRLLPARTFSPLLPLVCGVYPLSLLHLHPSTTKRLHSPCIFPRPSSLCVCTHSRCVNAAGQFQHSNQCRCAKQEETDYRLVTGSPLVCN